MKPRQPIKDAIHAQHAKAYLLRKCLQEDYLVQGALTEQTFAKMLSKFQFQTDDNDALEFELRHFHILCERNLDDKQWRSLRTAIRVKRAKKKIISVDLSIAAHAKLTSLAETISKERGHEVSLSEVILLLGKPRPTQTRAVVGQTTQPNLL